MDEKLAVNVEDGTAGGKDGEKLERWTAQSAATSSTQNEPKQRSWLKTVSIRSIMQDCNITTYQCRLSHPTSRKSIVTQVVDTE